MTINIQTHTIDKIHISHTIDELNKVEEFYFSVLSKIFLHKPVLIITIAPSKKYSIGYEIEPFQELKVEKSVFLINYIEFCSSSILMEISKSEEFNRGLLLLLTNETGLLENVEKYVKFLYHKIGIENFLCKTVVCENDGNSLCLYNTTIDPGSVTDLLVKN